MLHATSYILIAALYVATLFGLDKSIAITMHAAVYALMGLADFAAHTKNVRVGRWIALLGLILAFQTVEVGNIARDDMRPPIVCCPAALSRSPRAG